MNDPTKTVIAAIDTCDIAGVMLGEFLAAKQMGGVLVSDYADGTLMVYLRGGNAQIWTVAEATQTLRDLACSNHPWAQQIRALMTPEEQAAVNWREIAVHILDAMAAAASEKS